MRPARVAVRAGVLCSIMAAAVVIPAWPVAADSPASAGWWTRENPGLPVGPSEVVPRAVSPGGGPAGTPSDVPKGGLEVSSSPQGVVSYAAIGYYGNGRTVTALALTLAPGAVDLPNSRVEACPLDAPGVFTVEYGGPLAEGPGYDCGKAVYGVADPGNGTVTFAVGGLTVDGYLGVAILAVGNSRMVFSPPGPSSIETETGAVPVGSGGVAAAPPLPSPASPVGTVAPPTSVSPSGDGGPSIGPMTMVPPVPAVQPPTPFATVPRPSVAPASSLPPVVPVVVSVPPSTIKAGGAAFGTAFVLVLGLGVAVRVRRAAGKTERSGVAE